MKATPAEARETWPCPVARIFAEKKGPNCMADRCPLWRWVPLDMKADKFQAAIKKRAQELAEAAGEKNSIKWVNRASDEVFADRKKFGLPEGPTHGFCGLGGGLSA